MPRRDKSKYTDNQERKALAEGYEKRGVPEKGGRAPGPIVQLPRPRARKSNVSAFQRAAFSKCATHNAMHTNACTAKISRDEVQRSGVQTIAHVVRIRLRIGNVELMEALRECSSSRLIVNASRGSTYERSLLRGSSRTASCLPIGLQMFDRSGKRRLRAP
jgi:hypothetical protein